MAKKRITELAAETTLKDGQYVAIDHATDGTKKLNLGAELTDLKEDLSENVGDLKSAIQSVTEETGSETTTEVLTVVWEDNGVGADGTNVEAPSLHHTGKISVNAGDVITTPSGAFRFITAYNGNVADASKGDSLGELLTYTVPDGIDGVILTKYKTASSTIEKTYVVHVLSAVDSVARNNIEEVRNIIDVEQQEYTKTETLSLSWQSGYMNTNGGISQSSSLNYSNKIPVVPGDTISSRNTFRFVTAFNGTTAISAKGDASGENNTYTVPDGVDGIVITRYTTATGYIIKSSQVTKYVTQRKPFGIFRITGNMANGEVLSLADQNINKKLVTVFCADIQAFSKIMVGRKTPTDGYFVEVDNTNITIVKDGTRSPSVPHGLTISNNVEIRIATGTDGKTNPRNFFAMTVTLTSNGESFSTTDASWTNRSYGMPFAESDGSVLNNCALSCQSLDANKLIYAFGDSYFSWYPERWVYYLAEAGYADNILTNAFAGEGSQTAIEALMTLVPMGFPKYIFWCLGMNDGSDTSDAPSQTWAKGRDAVISICKEYGITPVFGTIPTVPTINNEQKNAWIRSSGYRYVDIAKAVGAQANGTWYSGMLDDGVHPTEAGARAIYNRVLADFPEIMIKN